MANVGQLGPNLANFGQDLGPRSDFSASCEQLFGDFWTISELVGPLGVTFRDARCASFTQPSGTFMLSARIGLCRPGNTITWVGRAGRKQMRPTSARAERLSGGCGSMATARGIAIAAHPQRGNDGARQPGRRPMAWAQSGRAEPHPGTPSEGSSTTAQNCLCKWHASGGGSRGRPKHIQVCAGHRRGASVFRTGDRACNGARDQRGSHTIAAPRTAPEQRPSGA